MVTSRDDVVGLDSSIILPRETWVASGHVGTFTDPLVECLNCHKRRRQDHLQEALAAKKGIDDPDSIEMSEIVCPDCGTKGQWTPPREFNMMLRDPPRRHRGRVRSALPAPRDGPGHLHQLQQRHAGLAQEAAVRHRPDRQELPQRDHARQLHLPHARVRADGDGVLRQAGRGRRVAPVLARRAHPLVRRPRHQPRQPASLRARAREAVALLEAHRRHRVPLQLRGLGVGRARGHRQPHRLRPRRRTRSTRAPTSSTSTRRRARSTPPTSSSPQPDCPARS